MPFRSMVVVLAVAVAAAGPAARSAHAQAIPFVEATTFAGNGESPKFDVDQGNQSAVSNVSDGDPQFGVAEAASATTGPYIFAHGTATAFMDAAWITGGDGTWIDEIQVPFTLSSVGGNVDLAGVRLAAAFSWSTSANGSYSFGINSRGTSYSSTNGFLFNDFGLPAGNAGAFSQFEYFPFDSVIPSLDNPNVYIGTFLLNMTMSGRAGSGQHTTGTFGPVAFAHAMRLNTSVDLVKLDPYEGNPTGGTPITRPGPIISESGIDYANLVVPTADFNSDGAVDGDDFLAWQRGAGKSVNAVRADGNTDVSIDGDVDGGDLSFWGVQYGFAPPAAVAAGVGSVSAVPEPGGAALVLFAVVAAAWRERRMGRG